MNYIKSLAINKGTALNIALFSSLIMLATFAPLIKIQAITGTLINASLFIAVGLLGLEAAILIGLIPSLIALSIGLLPAMLAPMIPFIMAGNIILVITFNCLNKKNCLLGAGVASIIKFLFLFSSSAIVINFFIKGEITANIAAMMSWPQLFTALAGGLIAYLVLKK